MTGSVEVIGAGGERPTVVPQKTSHPTPQALGHRECEVQRRKKGEVTHAIIRETTRADQLTHRGSVTLLEGTREVGREVGHEVGRELEVKLVQVGVASSQ